MMDFQIYFYSALSDIRFIKFIIFNFNSINDTICFSVDWWARYALSYPHEFLVVLFPSPKMLLFWERGKG